jgi:hypothetical protein
MNPTPRELKTYREIIENPWTSLEIMQVYLGKLIGEGASRWVFDYDNDTVLKIEKGDWMANVIEYDTWLAVQGTKWEKWFCPVTDISDNGRMLWMKKAHKLYEQPKHLPSFFADVVLSNLGEYNGHIVAVDYSINTILKEGLKNGKLIKQKEYIKE